MPPTERENKTTLASIVAYDRASVGLRPASENTPTESPSTPKTKPMASATPVYGSLERDITTIDKEVSWICSPTVYPGSIWRIFS